jgi:hypothetical protein
MKDAYLEERLETSILYSFTVGFYGRIYSTRSFADN